MPHPAIGWGKAVVRFFRGGTFGHLAAITALSSLAGVAACSRTEFWLGPAPEDAGGSDAKSNDGAALRVTESNKVDILLMLDNSSSMAQKHALLAAALPELVDRVAAIESLHVAVVTSSLGGHGASFCEDSEDVNDHGELLGSRPRARSLGLSGGFVEWTAAEGRDALSNELGNMVAATGEAGCALESQLEAVYRFLVDPAPPEDIALIRCGEGARCAAPVGVDELILEERARFLRPDSAVAIVVLSDENDCSIRDSDQYYYAADLSVFLPAAAPVCDENPNDPCCYSCGLTPPSGCAPDPACGPKTRFLDANSDAANLRCFDQRRRFGIDFLYPVARYTNAFTEPMICTTRVDLDASGECPRRPDGFPGAVRNPLYDAGSRGRDPSMVHWLGIVGVPWQDIAVDPNDTDLRFRSPEELESTDAWSEILGVSAGDAGEGTAAPSDPHMQESVAPRPGLPGPTAGYLEDPVSGHDWNSGGGDLQYACIYELPTPGPCDDYRCDCYRRLRGDNNPLCQVASGAYESVQHFGRAYPGLRELAVTKTLGKRGGLASICPRSLSDSSAQDYGYRPAIEALSAELSKIVK
jgi:hypothetical protein